MQQVAVRGVDLDDPEAGAERRARRRAKAATTARIPAASSAVGAGSPVRERDRARRRRAASHRRRSRAGRRRATARRCSPCGRRARAGCREPRHCASIRRAIRAQRLGLGVVPDARVRRRDPPVAHDRGRLGEDQRRAADRAAAEVDEVPVVRHPVLGRVLAHRRDDDPVPQRDGALRERREEGHRSYNAAARRLVPGRPSCQLRCRASAPSGARPAERTRAWRTAGACPACGG